MKIQVDAPDAPGVYIVWHQDRAYYVGMAKNLRKRLATHDRLREFERLEGDVRVETQEYPLHRIRSEEGRLIRELRPRANGYPIPFPLTPRMSPEQFTNGFIDWLLGNGPPPGHPR
jgi:hypothetical protein